MPPICRSAPVGLSWRGGKAGTRRKGGALYGWWAAEAISHAAVRNGGRGDRAFRGGMGPDGGSIIALTGPVRIGPARGRWRKREREPQYVEHPQRHRGVDDPGRAELELVVDRLRGNGLRRERGRVLARRLARRLIPPG